MLLLPVEKFPLKAHIIVAHLSQAYVTQFVVVVVVVDDDVFFCYCYYYYVVYMRVVIIRILEDFQTTRLLPLPAIHLQNGSPILCKSPYLDQLKLNQMNFSP